MYRWHFVPSSLDGCEVHDLSLRFLKLQHLCDWVIQVHVSSKWYDDVGPEDPSGLDFIRTC